MITTGEFFYRMIYTGEFFCRGQSGVRRNLVVALNVRRTSFTAKSEFQMMTTERGFSLKSGFKKYVGHRRWFWG